MRTLKDRYGFLFWMRWIVWFAGSFVLAAIFWTTLMKGVFGRIRGTELILTWAVSVFGSWFILIIPFMRKKEQIWKRLNPDQEIAVDAWFGGMSVFLALLVASAFFWSGWFLKGAPRDAGIDPRWVRAVFGTWLFITLPFLVVMYRQADRIFKNAHARQTHAPRFRSIFVDRQKRLLPEPLAAKVSAMPANLPKGHVVSLVLKDGRRIDHVFILGGREILGLYDRASFDFETAAIQDIQRIDNSHLPDYDESRWLRLDGIR
ncbi:MAG: hypothetical protein HYZ52_00570 [Candidatus Omnitrophica bacterium]|nr:hypothetical protein [Candidatus Omnitrophota bacterium]